MPEIIFPTSTAPGLNPTESGGRLINSQVELAPAGSRSKYVWRAVPGLDEKGTVGDDAIRGALKLNNTAVAINGDKAYSIASDYTATELSGDAVPGDDLVIMARNMNSSPQIMVVSEDGLVTIIGGVVATFTDADLPAPNSVCFKDGYFFFGIGDGRCFASGLNVTSVAATDVDRAESSPDSLVRVYPFPSGIALAGENTTELYTNTANPSGFPFSRSTVLPVGLFGKYAVTGFEEGFTGVPLFVANDATVNLLVGFSHAKISTPDLEALIEAIEDRSTLVASCYVANGQPVYVLRCDDWCWEYSPATTTAPEQWRERQSYGSDTWRALLTVNAFDKWLAFDTASTSVFAVTAGVRTEGDDPLIWEVRSTQSHRFPGRFRVKKASFDMNTGVGVDAGADTTQTDPRVLVSWSTDGGRTFGTALEKRLGTQGELRRVDINNAGISKRFGWQWKLRVSDPVVVALYGGAMDLDELAA